MPDTLYQEVLGKLGNFLSESINEKNTYVICGIKHLRSQNSNRDARGHINTDYNQLQKLWGKLLFEQFRVSTPFPILTMLRNNEQNLRQAMLWVCNIV